MIVMAPDVDNKGNRKHVGQLLSKVIARSEALATRFDANKSELTSGQWPSPGEHPEEQSHPIISLSRYRVSPWRDELVIRNEGAKFFEDGASSLEKISYGIHIHRVLSRIISLEDVPSVITQMMYEGVISLAEKQGLEKQLEALFQNAQIKLWFEKGWDVKTEVPILLPGGQENRIDRLLISGRRCVLIDFKTGNAVKADQRQVLDYMELLRKMNYPEIEGYLVYLKSGEVVSVMQQKTKVVKRKVDSQLDLGI